ncbi:hypothetical protein ACPROK_16090 [Glutamicibacter soli]|uniref:hypothetical protein n=1 Tax=Glutamicibacter soli TaxID=453836 RepID=UPI003C71EDE7
MSTVGVTREEIRENAHHYDHQSHGTHTVWLQRQPFSRATFYRWNRLVFEGDLDRHLIPRDHGQMNTAPRANSQHSSKPVPRNRQNTKLNWKRCVNASTSSKTPTRPWEKLSGSCTS